MRKLTLKVLQDDDPMDPREWDNLGIIMCFHQRYNIGDDHSLRHEDFNGWDDIEDYLIREEGATHILPIYMYDHGDITINTTGFSCPWDSGQIGFIYATKETIELCGTPEERVETVLKDEVDIYDRYLRCEVYGYVIEDEDGNHVDSCWGFYMEEEAEKEGRSMMEYKQECEERNQSEYNAMC